MIHIIWTGYGFLVAVFVFGFSLVANVITNAATGGGAYWNAHKWPVAVSLFMSAGACWLVGFVCRNRGKSHTLFFIPVIWWGPILVVCGMIALCAEFVRR
jgi:hypothetical protein